ncbi:aldo/keto reductase [Oceaniglobus trochenteri]|uniref:aldo/keto reductase n=1 Tax=Oceaniglobus trochenteri TaxID=2763260 RepID=UPI001D000576|nr:aldo/keto reductase [Oceaniglobus trochenteri]
MDLGTGALPEIGLGCAHLGNLFTIIDEDTAAATLAAAWEAGLRYYDTAPWYGHGLSELRLGAALRRRPREEYILSTKVGRVYDASAPDPGHVAPWKGALPHDMRYDYSAGGFARSLSQSRMRLGIDRIDMAVIHDLDGKHHGDRRAVHEGDLAESGLPYLQELRAAGQIHKIGMGMNTHEDFTHFAGRVDVDFFLVAMPYTLLDQAALAGPMQVCQERGIAVVIGAPFASGLLADPRAAGATYGYDDAQAGIRARAIAIDDLCRSHDVPIAAAALRFPLLHPAVSAVIPGATEPAHVRQNVDLMKRKIPAALWADLKQRGLIDPKSPTGDPA